MSPQSCYPDKAPAVDELLDTMSHHLRREVIHYFENAADARTAGLEELVATCERRGIPRTREEIKLQLVHTHLPKLADRGWLDYDRRTDRVRYHGHDRAERWLEEVHAVF